MRPQSFRPSNPVSKLRRRAGSHRWFDDAYLTTRLAAAQFPQKTQSQRGYPRLLGEGGQGGGDEGQNQGKRRPGALAVGAVREERQQGEEAGEKVGATDHPGHRLAVDRMRREQEAGDRVAEAVPSRQYLQQRDKSSVNSTENSRKRDLSPVRKVSAQLFREQ